MPDELPPLDKFVVSGYSEGHPDYPVVIIVKDSRANGYGAPASETLCPDSRYAAHKFTGVTPTNLDNRVIWTYELLPGPILSTQIRSAQVRGRTVDVTTQRGFNGTLPVESGNLVVSSQTQDLTSVVEQRTSQKVATLPPSESWAFWDFIPLPTLLFAITPGWFCNNSQFFSVVVNYTSAGGASALRKHRATRAYFTSYPDPDLSASTYAVGDIHYSGKVISFGYSNVLNDAISFDQDFYNSSDGAACFWTEAYTYAASTPSATDFAAGDWYVREFRVEPWGDSGWIGTKIEFYSAPGSPNI